MARARRHLPWIALAIYAFCCLFVWTNALWYPEWDSAIYLLTAGSMAAGEGYRYLGEAFTLRPPGFSWFLSFFADQGGFDFGRVNQAIMALAATSVAAIYFAVRVHGRVWLALSAALLTGTSASFASNFCWVQSEYLFASLCFLAIGCLHLATRGSMAQDSAPEGSSTAWGSRWWLWTIAGSLALAASIYVRTVGVLLWPALIATALTRRGEGPRWRALLPIGASMLLVLPWILHSRAASADAQRPAEQLFLFDYATAMLREDPGDPDSARIDAAGWLERIQSNGAQMARDLAETTVGNGAPWLAALLVALFLYGSWLAIRRGPALIGWFGVFGALLLLTYFTYAERLILPLIPCAYLAFFLALESLAGWVARRIDQPGAVPGVRIAAFALLFALNLITLSEHRAPLRGGPEQLARRALWSDFNDLSAWLRKNTPEDAVLLCNQAPILSFLSGRRAYTYRFQRAPDPLTRYEIDYAVFDGPFGEELAALVDERLADVWIVPSARGEDQPIPICKVRPAQ